MENEVQVIEKEKLDLVIIQEETTPAQIFSQGGAVLIFNKIKEIAIEFKKTASIATAKEREELKAFAFKITRSKTALDGLRKKLTEEWRVKTKQVDIEWKLLEEKLETLKDEIRKPLSDWEVQQKLKFESITRTIEELKSLSVVTLQNTSEHISNRIEHVNSVVLDQEYFGDYFLSADQARTNTLQVLRNALEMKLQSEKEKAELEQMRKEKEERDLKEKLERDLREAQERALKESVEKEENRKKTILNSIASIRAFGNLKGDLSISIMERKLSQLNTFIITEEEYQEFFEEAKDAKDNSVGTVTHVLNTLKEQKRLEDLAEEAEEKRRLADLKAKQEESERLKKEEDEKRKLREQAERLQKENDEIIRKQNEVELLKLEEKKQFEKPIPVDRKSYVELVCAEKKLRLLEGGGVDNWEWYGEALNPDGAESYSDFELRIEREFLGE